MHTQAVMAATSDITGASVSKKSEIAGAPALFDKPELAAPRFRGGEDALDYAARSVEEANRIFAASNLGLIKAYIEGDACVVVPVFADSSASKYDLVFFAVVDGLKGDDSRWTDVMDADISPADHDGDQRGVGRITQLVHCPNGFIPSLVRLERAKERHDFFRDVFADFSPFYQVFEFGSAVADRELSSFGGEPPGCDGGTVSGLIKGRSEVFQSLLGDDGANVGQSRFEFEFEHLLSWVAGIRLVDHFVWLFEHENSDECMKFGNVFAATREPRSGAGK